MLGLALELLVQVLVLDLDPQRRRLEAQAAQGGLQVQLRQVQGEHEACLAAAADLFRRTSVLAAQLAVWAGLLLLCLLAVTAARAVFQAAAAAAGRAQA